MCKNLTWCLRLSAFNLEIWFQIKLSHFIGLTVVIILQLFFYSVSIYKKVVSLSTSNGSMD